MVGFARRNWETVIPEISASEAQVSPGRAVTIRVQGSAAAEGRGRRRRRRREWRGEMRWRSRAYV